MTVPVRRQRRWRRGCRAPHSPRVRVRLLDNLVGDGEQRFRDDEAERLGGLEVDDRLELGRLLYRQISRLRTLKSPPTYWTAALRKRSEKAA
jgi:hypothetical protein